jgi:hypothetical protein
MCFRELDVKVSWRNKVRVQKFRCKIFENRSLQRLMKQMKQLIPKKQAVEMNIPDTPILGSRPVHPMSLALLEVSFIF